MTVINRSYLILALLLFGISGASAQNNLHPAYKAAEKYLRAIHLHQWEEAVDLVETKSLENLKTFQRQYLLDAPTIREEQELLRLLGMNEISDLDDMAPREVFIRRGQAKTKRLIDPEKHVAEMKASLAMKTLGTAPESATLVHSVIRKEFATEDRAYSELPFVSLVKEGTVWKVSLEAQEPKVIKLEAKKKDIGASDPSNLHPAYIVAEKYLRTIHLHEWEEAADLVETKSLENLKTFQRQYLLQAPTLPEEQELLRLLGMSKISDLDDMEPREVFIRRGQAKTKRLIDPEKHVAEMKASLAMKTLGTAPEGSALVHAVIRKMFTTEDQAVEELSFVSLVKEGTVWKVSLDAQEPKVFKLKSKEKEKEKE